VRATRRGSTKVDHLAHVPIEWVDAGLDDVGALEAALHDADVVFHCAAQVSVRRKVTPDLVKANVDGTRNVLEAVRRSGAKRLVHCSTTTAVGLSTDGTPCTEDSPYNMADFGLADAYSTTKHAAEGLVKEAAGAGLDAVIVNPGYMFGPLDTKPSSGKLIVDYLAGKVVGRVPGKNCFVDVRDVARGMIAAWEKGRPGERYILGGENLSYGALFDRIADVAGRPRLRHQVPAFAARLLGLVGDAGEALFAGEPVINSSSMAFAYCERFIFSSEKAKRELGYTIGPLDVAIRDALDWFRAHGMVK
jgi:dihydroflavonol-4-reductase